MYLRGNPRDFDAWQDAGNPGWNYQSVLPYFKKSEHQSGRFKMDGNYLYILNAVTKVFKEHFM
jgi:choline dehydrogenase-like flavoprotein